MKELSSCARSHANGLPYDACERGAEERFRARTPRELTFWPVIEGRRLARKLAPSPHPRLLPEVQPASPHSHVESGGCLRSLLFRPARSPCIFLSEAPTLKMRRASGFCWLISTLRCHPAATSAGARTRWPRRPACEGHRSAACDALYSQRPAIWASSGPGIRRDYWILAAMARGARLSAISTTTSTATPSRQDARIDRYDPVLPLPAPK